MNVDWRFAPDPPAEPSPAGHPRASGPPPRARVLAAAGVAGLLAAGLGLRAWENARVLERAAADARVVVAAEEAALARGDVEVARLHQTAELRRTARDPRHGAGITGPPRALPGLVVGGAGAVAGVEAAVEPGGRVARADAVLAYAVTDGELTGTFRLTRPMERGEDGRWRHGIAPAAAPPPTTTLRVGSLAAAAPEADRAWLEAALAEADDARARLCARVRCGVGPDRVLELDLGFGAPAGGGRDPSVGGPAAGRRHRLALAASPEILRPADDAAAELLRRAVVRAVLAHSVLAHRDIGFRFPADVGARALAAGLAEAALAAEAPAGGPAAGTGAIRPLTWTLGALWPGRAPDSPEGRAAAGPSPVDVRVGARALGTHVAARHGAEGLRRLIEALPGALGPESGWPSVGATSPYRWLETALDEGMLETALGWPEAQRPAPPRLGFVAECLVGDGQGGLRGVPLLVAPGRAPERIDRLLCGDGGLPIAPLRAAAGRVAALCGTGAGAGPPQPDDRALVLAVREPDGAVRRVALEGAPRTVLAGPAWSSDGAALAVVLAEGGNPADAFLIEPWLVEVRGDGRELAPRRLERSSLGVDRWPTAERHAAIAWRPGGRDVAIVAHQGAGPRVVVHEAGGTAARWSAPGFAPAWSADGRRLAIVADVAGPRVTLEVRGADEGASVARHEVDLTGTGLRSGVARDGAPGASPARPSWSPDDRWVALHVLAENTGLLALVAWRPDGDVLRVAEYPTLQLHGGNWRTAWHPDEPVALLLRNDTFPERGEGFAWQTEIPPLLALDAATGTARTVAPDDPLLAPLRWPVGPGGRRVTRDEVGRLRFEPPDGGESWRLNAPACVVDVEWLDAPAEDGDPAR